VQPRRPLLEKHPKRKHPYDEQRKSLKEKPQERQLQKGRPLQRRRHQGLQELGLPPGRKLLEKLLGAKQQRRW